MEISAADVLKKEFDFVIVGAGSAGCVLASRLSEDPSVSVLLVEAGSSRRSTETALNTAIPAAVGKLQHRADADWGFYAEPQPGVACTALTDGKSYWPRGKGLGGSSCLNYMAYVRGNRHDYDGWAKAGATGWAYADVLPLFIRSEDASMCDPDLIDQSFHGEGGPLSVASKKPPCPLAEAFVMAAVEAGHAHVDYNGVEQCGAALHQHTVRHGTRCHTARAFLDPLKSGKDRRPNLSILCDAHVARLLLEEAEDAPAVEEAAEVAEEAESAAVCVGVELLAAASRRQPTRLTVKARREVVLCAGAIGSPQILLLSGIGPRDELEAMGVRCAVHSPEVGRHLQDHLTAPLRWSPRAGQGKPGAAPKGSDIGSVNSAKAEGPLTALPNMLRMYLFGSGMLSTSAYDASCFIRTETQQKRHGDASPPDLQLSCFASGADENVLHGNIRLELDGWIGPEEISSSAEGLFMCCTLLHPRSCGRVTLNSADPLAPPRIEAGYLTDKGDDDLRAMVEAMKRAAALGQQPALARLLGATPLLPVDLLRKHGVDASAEVLRGAYPAGGLPDAFWGEYVRRYATTLYHPVGTCRIGEVVDPKLRVHGVRGLRIADGSVMPEIVSGNTNAACIMIGEKATDLLREEHGLEADELALCGAAAVEMRGRLTTVCGFLSILVILLVIVIVRATAPEIRATLRGK